MFKLTRFLHFAMQLNISNAVLEHFLARHIVEHCKGAKTNVYHFVLTITYWFNKHIIFDRGGKS